MLQWSPAQQAVGFRTIERRFVTHLVRRGPHVHELPRARRQLDMHFQYAGTDYTTARFMAAGRVSGLLVIRDGRIVLERYGLGRGPRDRWTSFSVAKSITSTLVGAAVRDGYIHSLDDPVSRYLPEMAGSAYDGVSIRQLLTMSSGVRWTETYGDPNSDVVRIGSSVAPSGLDPIVAYMRTLPRVAPAGSQFHYKSGEADLAGVLVARATGRSLAQYLSEKIWRPYGMERDAAWIVDGAHIERGGCCLSMTLRDYGRYGLFMLQGARAGGPVVPDGWVEAATSQRIATEHPGAGYGYMWWTSADGSYRAAGIFGQLIEIVPADRLVIVINAAWSTPGSQRDVGLRSAFVAAVRGAPAP
jgi:CubicO group peptidase (beta-lactamase class C family)